LKLAGDRRGWSAGGRSGPAILDCGVEYRGALGGFGDGGKERKAEEGNCRRTQTRVKKGKSRSGRILIEWGIQILKKQNEDEGGV